MKFKALDAKVQWEVYMDVDQHPTQYKYQLHTRDHQFFFSPDLKHSKFVGILVVARATILTYAGCAFKDEVPPPEAVQKDVAMREEETRGREMLSHAHFMDIDLHLPDRRTILLRNLRK